MAKNELKIQKFRINDLSQDSGKQFECGVSWCEFLEINNDSAEIEVILQFKPLDTAYTQFSDKQIILKLSELTNRKDRKVYSNGASTGHSAIKEFFLNDLKLNETNNINDYFAVLKTPDKKFFLYYVPKVLYSNFLRFFDGVSPSTFYTRVPSTDYKGYPLQQIIYGAPGTGKSNYIKENIDMKGLPHLRTTFHPDSDYTSFVGAYKPISKKKPVTGIVNEKQIENSSAEQGPKIVYDFIPQAFLKAYTQAWKTKDEPFFLIIEEINRGNCAQIFGDLFQLLDRDEKTMKSKYSISPDEDIQNFLASDDRYGFASITEEQRLYIPKEIIDGEKMQLPPNLYIWATMNTSDQSLFPIDSAFKRRWEWKYMKIRNYPEINYKIQIGANNKDWYPFIEKINEIIASMTSSADKQLGYFFCVPENGIIDETMFVSKVIFYLWNDVFKDYGFEDASLFQYTTKDKEGKDITKELTFPDFYEEDGEGVNIERVLDFYNKVMNWKNVKEDNN